MRQLIRQARKALIALLSLVRTWYAFIWDISLVPSTFAIPLNNCSFVWFQKLLLSRATIITSILTLIDINSSFTMSTYFVFYFFFHLFTWLGCRNGYVCKWKRCFSCCFLNKNKCFNSNSILWWSYKKCIINVQILFLNPMQLSFFFCTYNKTSYCLVFLKENKQLIIISNRCVFELRCS